MSVPKSPGLRDLKQIYKARAVCRCMAMVAALGLLTGPSFGQILYGTVVGAVRDPTGAAIPNAGVIIVNQRTEQGAAPARAGPWTRGPVRCDS